MKDNQLSTQYFIEIFEALPLQIKLGNLHNGKKIYFKNQQGSFQERINEIFQFIQKPIFYIHGYYSATYPIRKRTFDGFKLFLEDNEAKTDGIIHIIWNATTLNYVKSLKIINNTIHSLGHLINNIHHNYPKLSINLICHSMGNKLFLETIKAKLIPEKTISKLILSAPDIGVHEFIEFQKSYEEVSQEILVLFHKYDKVLAASNILNRKTRLGQNVNKINKASIITFLDCSNVVNEQNLISKLNKHFYFVASKEVRIKLHFYINDATKQQAFHIKKYN